MTRSITAGMITEITAGNLRPIALVKFAFDSGDLNLWSGVGDLLWAGDTYTGSGNLLGVSEITETSAIVANGVVFSLSGMPSSIISTALSEDYQGRTVSMWYGALDSSRAIVADPIQIFSGTMDVMEIVETGDTTVLSVAAESELRSLTRKSPRVWTDQDQRSVLITDRGFSGLALMQDTPLQWG